MYIVQDGMPNHDPEQQMRCKGLKPDEGTVPTATQSTKDKPSVPSGERPATIRERAVLQTFPLDFEFGPHSETALGAMIGNAVPPQFGMDLLRHVRNALRAADGLSVDQDGGREWFRERCQMLVQRPQTVMEDDIETYEIDGETFTILPF